ncbi:glycosyltransferase family 2 protein [Ramlibacter alkalitolerans]|uniref:Glycosyltransferase family 2 protein n=1 Tax=Ramlibacter alkalitolerans TaxID=2039631 RepID=A0ABS1JTS9_9BURK|nr:glycosyltransferase family 2 protein [Ramlibacter alkalitolerans]MBL0427581.1 glycosyltransferase family 2 protein [Ramlibacter alkalitolerans]
MNYASLPEAVLAETTVEEPAVGELAALPAHSLSVVVPMYNEVENATALIDAVQAALAAYPWPWELIVVDDGSTDGTGRTLDRRARETGTHIRVLHLARNFRQTAAMQAGIDASRGDVVATLDGDLQNDPADIPRMVARLLAEDLDMVAGWRRQRQDGMFLRKIPSMLANRLIRRVSGLKFQDLGCSLKIFRGSVLRQVRLYGEMHRFIPAWLATVTSPSRMAEEPVRHHARRAGSSKYGISRTFRVLIDLLAIHFFLRFGTRPGHFFGGIGLGVLFVGSLMLAYMGVLKLTGHEIGTRPMLSLGFFLVLGGVQLLTTGVLAELLMRVYFDVGRARPYRVRAGEGSETPGEAPAEAGWHG